MTNRPSLRIIHANIFTPTGHNARRGAEMNALHHIEDGEVEAIGGTITYVGPTRDNAPSGIPVIDARGRALLPGFVDSHTHTVFGGYRPDEFGWRMRGDSYMSIMERGGGIASTVKATKTATHAQLEAKARMYIDEMSRMGVTTVEMKSGYGLDRDTELKQLEVIKALADDPSRKVEIVSTFLGAHAMPAGYNGSNDDYIDFLINEMLPVVKERRLAANCDIFCEKGVFTIDESRRLLTAARDMGMGVKIHADEIVNTGGAELAAEVSALSADHLLHISDEGISALAASSTVATLLPLTAFALREPYAPGRRLIDSSAAVALATDFNPGSCFSCSIPLMIAIACIHMGLTVEETVTALTLNGAAALGIASDTGSIEEGKRADMALLRFDSPSFLPYFTGLNCVDATIANGVVVSDSGHTSQS